MNPADGFTIDRDVACPKCGYNLRGLAFNKPCPECGDKLMERLRRTVPGEWSVADYASYHEVSRVARDGAAEHAGVQPDAVRFVRDALARAARASRAANKDGRFPPDALCRAVREHALAYFNDVAEARELLAEWGIHRSEDVGRIVFAMVDIGLASRDPDDTPEAFNGLFTLDDLFRDDETR